MKKAVLWTWWIALAVFVIALGMIGVKLLNGDYGIRGEAYIA